MAARHIAPILLAAAASLWAQGPNREGYRQAYQAWRQMEPTLEHDAATAEAALAPRTQHAATGATAFTTAREAFLNEGAEAAGQRQLWLQNAPRPQPSIGIGSPAVALAASQSVVAILSSFAGVADPAIGQLRQQLEKERATLEALTQSIQRRQEALTSVTQADNAAEVARMNALEAYKASSTRRTQSAEQVRKESAAWQTYYQLLADGARSTAISAVVPAPTGAPTAPPAAKPVAASKSITPLPLARYTGGWTYPANGIFKGAQPEFVDVVVHEENGRITGTLYGRFVLPAGSPGDPILRFDFEGNLQPQRNQTFSLRTTEGATGTIDLIPGPAFNLLEVNFRTTPVDKKVSSGNFVLLKK